MIELKSWQGEGKERGGGKRTSTQNRLPLLLALLDRETHLLSAGT